MVISGIVFTNQSKAQVNVNINIGSQPVWGPVGYDHVDYYYLPDIDAYYYVPQRQYIYLNNGRWTFASALPMRFKNYDIYKSYKVVVNEPKPYLHPEVYRAKYQQYKGWKGNQPMIRDNRDDRYKQARDHGYGKNDGPGRGRGRDNHRKH